MNPRHGRKLPTPNPYDFQDVANHQDVYFLTGGRRLRSFVGNYLR